MMFNNFQGHGESEGRKRASEPNRKLGDREVPLSGIDAIRSRAVHAWLDGSAPERDVRQGEWARDVDFWKRLDEDLVHRRHMRTPVGLNARIMNAIPSHAPVVITPWWKREFVIKPSSAAFILVSMMAAASAATAALLHGR